MAEQVEQKSVSTQALSGGVHLRAGHPVVLIVDGAHGTPRKDKDAGAPAEESETAPAEGASPAAEAGPRPASAPRAAPGWASGASTMTPVRPPTIPEPPATSPPRDEGPEGALHQCKFEDGTDLPAPDLAWVAAKCSALDGEQVQFVLEEEGEGGWSAVASAVSTVKCGEARAGISIPADTKEGT